MLRQRTRAFVRRAESSRSQGSKERRKGQLGSSSSGRDAIPARYNNDLPDFHSYFNAYGLTRSAPLSYRPPCRQERGKKKRRLRGGAVPSPGGRGVRWERGSRGEAPL